MRYPMTNKHSSPSGSPRKRLFSAKRVGSKEQQQQQQKCKAIASIKTGSSIETLKEVLMKQTQMSNKHTNNLNYFVHNNKRESQNKLDTKTSDSTERVNIRQGTLSKEKTTISELTTKKTSITKSEFEWNKCQLPLTPQFCLAKYGYALTEFEKTEILTFKRIYCIGINAKKIQQSQSNYNDGFDNAQGEYLYALHDHIGYRYELLEHVGSGSFGQAFKVFDHKRQQVLCLKVIRNQKKFQNQALVELNILSFIRDKDEENITNIVKIKDFVIFRNHVCIICELLSLNLYELIKNNNYQGLSLELIRRFAIQILNALNFLYKHKIIHCDLKPENILLKQPNKSGIKIIDFGSSCFENERIYSYIQSRYYRAPEVIFGIPYDMGIDMWSFGCIMAELYIGYPIFPGENEQEQIAYIMEIKGIPDQSLIEKATRKKHFFTSSTPYQPLPYKNKRGKVRVPKSKDLQQILKCQDKLFIDFLDNCFNWDPQKRMKPIDALMHQWILEGLPKEIRTQHIKYLESEQMTQKVFFKNTETKRQHHISEPEMEKKKSSSSYSQKKSKEKDINLTLYGNINNDTTPQNKRILSQSFHTSKNGSNQKYQQYFPGTTKNQPLKYKFY
ncbi:unnamed protein product [Paramecium pentaurelia]|uniref:Protein kinase domain-containing protein n=1 Tax=Paramecium pentaurelia TaxID=43138 RepID=A0A8S1VVZ4_9CILI|nr:unnamed protein product [Paramecium pentaurelia]